MRAPTQFATTTTPTASTAASLLVSTAAGTLTALQAINGSGVQRYLMLFDAVALPADGATPTYVFPIGASATLNLPAALTFATGCAACLSSTAPTKTITAADSTFTSTFKSAATPVASAVIATAACAVEFVSITNTSGADRFYILSDTASVPPFTAAGAKTGPTGLRSPRIGAGAAWTPFPVDAANGTAFSRGCVALSFACTTDGQPDFSALSSADAVVTAWSTAMT
jgi:hypothetical protein